MLFIGNWRHTEPIDKQKTEISCIKIGNDQIRKKMVKQKFLISQRVNTIPTLIMPVV